MQSRRRPTDHGGLNRTEVEARLALFTSWNRFERNLEVLLTVGFGDEAAVGTVDDFRAVAGLDGRSGDIASSSDLVGDARMAPPPVGHSTDAGRGIGFRDSPGEVLGAG